MITHKQLSLAEVFENFQNNFDNDRYLFLSLLDETINVDEIVPVSFVSHFHARTGRPRKHQLYPAQGTSIPAYFLNPDRHAPDCVFEVLSGIV